ncbi:hypothetical protein CFC21_063347 [Triticum aestivum]|uniref:Fungal lipase-like domain-containing protein n=3 Tax=Triticum aestivum TaxID=4565 RepID=A0A9R1KJ13_WHEAT|nr:hypothetical protein CFC21_063347 [Triticum aestivum]
MDADADADDRFHLSGPTHMIPGAGGVRSLATTTMMIDWDNEEHRRCIAACIVKGTYILEDDRNTCRLLVGEALAPAWWESFHFRIVKVLKDDCGRKGEHKFIFGAIYEHVPPAGAPRHPSAPQYVVALRGTMLRHPDPFKDLWLDLKVMANTLHRCKRSERARAEVEALLGAGCSPVWLTGHSLGASLALDVGRRMMAENGVSLPTFLFNPPQVSPAPVINALHPTEVGKRDLYATSYVLKAGLGLVLSPHRKRMETLFQRLAPWAPRLYVHDRDVVCLGFIDYFQQRQLIQERFRGVARSAMTLSYRDMLFSLVGADKERPHLLPSAMLVKNSSDCDAHGLEQWWKPDGQLNLSATRYSYPGA